MKNIVLYMENGEREFEPLDFIPGRIVRDALDISKNTDFKDIKADDMDKMIQFVAKVYGGQFTKDEFYDGIPIEKMLQTILDTLTDVMDRFSKVSKNVAPAE